MIAEDLTDGRLVLKTISRNLAIDEGGSLAFYDRSGLERLFCVSGTPPDHGIHVYADQASRRTLLRLICRHAVDLYHLIEVYDPEHDEVVGFVHRDGMRSTMREQWAIEGPDREAVICRVEETETVRHLLRYLLGEHCPLSYHGTVQGRAAFKLTRGLDAGGSTAWRWISSPGWVIASMSGWALRQPSAYSCILTSSGCSGALRWDSPGSLRADTTTAVLPPPRVSP